MDISEIRHKTIRIHFDFKKPLNENCKQIAAKIDRQCANKIVEIARNFNKKYPKHEVPIEIENYNPETFTGDAIGNYWSLFVWVNDWYEDCGFDTIKTKKNGESWRPVIYEEDFIEFFNVTENDIMEVKPSDMDSFITEPKPSNVVKILFYGEDDLSESYETEGYVIKVSDLKKWAKNPDVGERISDACEYYEVDDLLGDVVEKSDNIEPEAAYILQEDLENGTLPSQKVSVTAEFSVDEDLGHEGIELISPKDFFAIFSSPSW